MIDLRRLALVCTIVACGDTTTTTPTQLNLNRPNDIAFACYGGLRLTAGGPPTIDQEIVQSAQPIQGCDIRSQSHAESDPAPVPPGQETLGPTSNTGSSAYYAFILQSAPGTVALAQWETKPTSLFTGGDVLVLDADPLTPGKNGITVGEDPVAIATDTVGCFELTANAGSCDMSSLDINSAINYATNITDSLASGQPVKVERFAVKNMSGVPVRAKAAAMVAEPAGGTIGMACPATPTGLVYVAYPNCHLVAGIDTSTGTVVTGVQWDGAAWTIVNGDVTCPDECGGGGAIGAGPRPITLDLQHDPRTDRRVLAIGSQNESKVVVVELGIDNRPASVSPPIQLDDPKNNLGVTYIKVSPTIGMGGSSGFINDDSALGGEAQYLYAITTDDTIRVVNIDGALNKECDTQVDPRYLHDVKNVKTLSCMVVNDPATPPRRPGVKGPGIELVGGAVPTSIEVFRVDGIDGDTRIPGTPGRLVGYFGVITGANGGTYMLNIDNDDFADFVDTRNPVATPIPLDIANQLRDGVPDRGALAQEQVDDGSEVPICDTDGPDPDGASGNSAGPRSVGSPARSLPANILAPEKVGALPSIRQVKCLGADENRAVSELAFAAPLDVRDSVFPDLRGLRGDESWTLTWEGSLSIDGLSTSVDGPAIRTSQLFSDAGGLRLVDQSHPYCDAGVEPYDIVQLRGCDPALGDADCPLGYTCFVHPNSQVTGLGACMLTTEADRLANACREFLTSLRRYTVGLTSSGTLQLLPRKHVLRTTPVDGCTSDDQCKQLANYALQNNSSAHPIDDMTAADTHTYSCSVDDQRKPELDAVGMPMKRCIQTCAADGDCDPGSVCSGGICMEGVIPPQSCINAPQRYEMRVGEAFSVVGTRTGFTHPIIQDASGQCVKGPDPVANYLQLGRLPLRAPPCDPTADPRTGKLPAGGYEPNPCELTVDETENQTNYVAGTCTVGSPSTNLITRPADAIKFRNRGLTMTMVDPTYPGDATCIGDMLGGLGKVPIVPPLFQTSVRITAGFQPFLINIQPAYPVKVTRGPGQSIWVIDEGDFLSTSLAAPSTLGKVYRIESQATGIINLLE